MPRGRDVENRSCGIRCSLLSYMRAGGNGRSGGSVVALLIPRPNVPMLDDTGVGALIWGGGIGGDPSRGERHNRIERLLVRRGRFFPPSPGEASGRAGRPLPSASLDRDLRRSITSSSQAIPGCIVHASICYGGLHSRTAPPAARVQPAPAIRSGLALFCIHPPMRAAQVHTREHTQRHRARVAAPAQDARMSKDARVAAGSAGARRRVFRPVLTSPFTVAWCVSARED